MKHDTHPLPDLTDPVAITQALIRRPSVTPDDAGALGLVETSLGALGFDVHRMTFSDEGTPDIDNVYGRLGASGPNLCFAGHTDVVPPGDIAAWTSPPFDAEIRDGVLYGRGAVDMKGAIGCFMAALARVLKANEGLLPSGSVSFLITGDEEGPAINGTVKVLDWLANRGETLDACIVGEPSNPNAIGDSIKIGRRGSINGELVVKGRQGHAAYPAHADNPIPKLASLLTALCAEPLDAGTAHFEPSSLEPTILSVPNTATNVIPAHARAVFNVRYNDTWSRETLEAHLKSVCEKTAAPLGAEFDLSLSGTGGVFVTEPGPLVDTLSEAISHVTGRMPEYSTGGGTSDARFIKDACPVVEFGLVNETIHKVDEQVPVSDLELLTEIYAGFISRFLNSH
ncbi:MAG: succinyl-diaminopimelate desuccinylase [Pseudomonadota bacterium]